jgi:hypothetical protein
MNVFPGSFKWGLRSNKGDTDQTQGETQEVSRSRSSTTPECVSLSPPPLLSLLVSLSSVLPSLHRKKFLKINNSLDAAMTNVY